jgi:hypothetical protein
VAHVNVNVANDAFGDVDTRSVGLVPGGDTASMAENEPSIPLVAHVIVA